MVAILASSGSSRSRSFARPPGARASTRLRARAARGQAGRDFSSKLAWLERAEGKSLDPREYRTP